MALSTSVHPPSAIAGSGTRLRFFVLVVPLSTQDYFRGWLSITTENLDGKDGFRYILCVSDSGGWTLALALDRLSVSFLLRPEQKMSYSFDAEDANLIFRSADCEEFRVHRCILSIASPVFRDMFGFPQPPDLGHELPRVDLSETATTLDIFLRYIYPIPSPRIEDFATLCSVLVSAEKYGAEGVVSRLRTILASPHFLDLDPLRVYAIACRWSFLEEARLASTHTVYADIVKQGAGCTEDMKYMSGLDYHRLLVLQQARKDTFQKAITDQPAPGGCCSVGYNDVKKLLVEEMPRKKLDVSGCLSVLEGSGKVKPCKSGLCPLGHAKLEVFVKGVMSGIGELPASI